MYAIPTEKDYNEVKEYIDILVSYGFGNWSDNWNYSKWVIEYENELADNYGFNFYDGCTKIVVTNADSKWVIKIDMDSDWTHRGHTYCELEALNWIQILEAGFEKYFAATYFVEMVNGIEFFMQEYAEADESVYSSRCYDYYCSSRGEDEDEEDYCSDYWDMDDSERLVAIYGADYNTHELINFCWDMHINDLHCGNFGETADGRTVIFDYSGY